MVYQETYHEGMYAQHHLKGKKQDFFWRLDTPDRSGEAGIDKIGLGALIGLSDSWRVDCFMVAEHLLWLQQRYWRSRYSISFPRLRPLRRRHYASLINGRTSAGADDLRFPPAGAGG